MDLETYAQLALPAEQVGATADYLREGATAQLPMYEGKPIGIDLPASVELEVTVAEPGVKGDRVSGATKPITVETGLVVQVPLFVEQGDVIKVDTRSGAYMTRVT
jgi:elongation factor P